MNKKSIKKLRVIQVQRINKILESYLDKNLYDIVSRRMSIRLPKILTERKVDESLEPGEVTKEMKRRKKIRRMNRQSSVQEFKVSQFPKTYRSSYFNAEDIINGRTNEIGMAGGIT